MGRFTRRLQTEPAQAQKGGVPQVNSELARELVDLGALDFTGELIVSFQESSHSASIFFFEGAPYACTLAHMQGHPLARLVSAGRISTSDRRSIDELVDQGVITAETLGVVNQEFFLDQMASLLMENAVVNPTRNPVNLSRVADSTTNFACSLPIDWESLQQILLKRIERMDSDCASLNSNRSEVSHLVLKAGNLESPFASEIMEYKYLYEFVDSDATMAQCAEKSGMTMAEVVHLAASMARNGIVEVGPATHSKPGEQFMDA